MKKEKSKKKIPKTIKVMFKTEKKKKGKSKEKTTRNVKLLIDFIEKNCMFFFIFAFIVCFY